MTRTVKLADVGISYEEKGTYSIFIHLVDEGDRVGFYATQAENELLAIMSAASNGRVVFTVPLLQTLMTLEDNPKIDGGHQKG